MKVKSIFLILSLLFVTISVTNARRSEQGPEDMIPEKLFDKKMIAKNSVISCEFRQFGYQFGNPTHESLKLRKIKYSTTGDTLEILFYDDGQPERKLVRKYDESGNCTEESNFNPEGELLDKFKYKFDNGKITEVWFYKGDQTPEYKDKRVYDENGMLTKETRFLEAEIEHNVTYKYNAQKLQTEMLRYAGDGELRSKLSTRYDPNGNKTEEIYYEGGEIESKSKYIYDNNKNMTQEWHYRGDGSLVSKKAYKYDASNRLTEKAYFDESEALVQKLVYKMRDDGLPVEVAIFEGNTMVNTWKFSFCYPDGLLKQATWYNNIDEPVMHIEYKYDPPQVKEQD